jgi:hypothetical protein
MSPGRSNKGIHFKANDDEIAAFAAFHETYAPRCSKGDLCRIAIMKLIREHGFFFPDIVLDNMKTDYPLERKLTAGPLPKPKKK